jgi:anti-anti-sigma factor
MVQVTRARGWDLDVERGPDSLFVHPYRLEDDATLAPALAEQIWALLEQNLTHRLVLELNDIGHLNSHLIGELVWLHKRIHSHDGMMRICGLSSNNEKVLEQCHLSGYLPHFRNREEAVMGQPRPKQPR